MIDEAQEYQDDQESTLKYVVTDSKNPQTLMCGTPPTPISSGTVFKKYRDTVLQGTGQSWGWAEWSVPELTDMNDREVWYDTNPSLGQTLLETAVADEVRKTEEEKIDFNIQRLGLWIHYDLKSAISKAAWDGITVKELPELKSKLAVGIKYAKDSISMSMAVAARTEDGRIFFEVIRRGLVREGNDWIVAFLIAAGKNISKIVIDGKNGQEILKKDMRDAGIKREPVLPTVSEIIEANQAFENNLYQRTLCHMEQPSLDRAATSCLHRAIGSSGGFGYKATAEEIDISLLDSVILACWAAENYREKQQHINY